MATCVGIVRVIRAQSIGLGQGVRQEKGLKRRVKGVKLTQALFEKIVLDPKKMRVHPVAIDLYVQCSRGQVLLNLFCQGQGKKGERGCPRIGGTISLKIKGQGLSCLEQLDDIISCLGDTRQERKGGIKARFQIAGKDGKRPWWPTRAARTGVSKIGVGNL